MPVNNSRLLEMQAHQRDVIHPYQGLQQGCKSRLLGWMNMSVLACTPIPIERRLLM